MGFWSANKQRYYTVQPLVVQLSSERGYRRLLTVERGRINGSFLDLFVQLSYKKQFIMLYNFYLSLYFVSSCGLDKIQTCKNIQPSYNDYLCNNLYINPDQAVVFIRVVEGVRECNRNYVGSFNFVHS